MGASALGGKRPTIVENLRESCSVRGRKQPSPFGGFFGTWLARSVGYVTVARGLAARTARQELHSLHGEIQDMPLSVRTYDCPACGLSIDRDLNASLNILNWEPKAIGG